MFKKNIWIVGLLAALAIMFIGCVDAYVDEDGVEKVVFDLQEALADAPVGPIANDDAWTAIFKKTPFMMCGGPANGQYSIINDGGTKKVKVEKMGPTWGVGFDLYTEAKANACTGASFKKGDVLTIKGTASADGLILNTNTAGEARLGNKDLDRNFDETFELTGDDAANTRKGNPKALRIHFKNNNGSERKGVIIIEQITLTGKRKAGDDATPPPAGDDDDYVVGKVYQVPADDDADSFYMDLNRCLSTSAEVGNNDAEKAGSLVPVPTTIAAGNVTFIFTKLNQRIAIKFTEDQLTRIADGGGAKVTITGTATINGSVCTDSWRYHIGDIKATSNWNASNGNGNNDFATIAAENSQSFTGNYKERKSIRHLILNYRGTTGTGAATVDNATVVITKIKIEPTPAKMASLTIAAGTGDDKIAAPIAGKAAKDIVETAGFKGSIDWYPEPKNGRFALATIYYAKIVLTPKPGYSLPVSSADIATAAPLVAGVAAFYNPETRTLTTANFARTDPKYPPLPEGQFWKLSKWITDQGWANDSTGGKDYWNCRPFTFNNWTSGGTGSYGEITTRGTTVIVPASIRTATHHGIDIYLNVDSMGDGALDPGIYKVNVTIKGKVLSTGTAIAKFDFLAEESDGAYLKAIEKKDLALPATGDLAFDWTGEIPEKFSLSNKLRIHPSVKDVGFELEEVIFENKGLR